MNIGLSLRKLSPGTPGHVGGRRLFKDEAAASIARFGGFHPPTWEAHPGRSGRWMEIRGRIVMFGDVGGWLNEGVVALVADNRAEWAHIARHDPDRVLQDVESGRRVLEWAHTSTAPLADRIAVVAALAYRSKSGPSGQQEEAL